jgi:hypothetical protein
LALFSLSDLQIKGGMAIYMVFLRDKRFAEDLQPSNGLKYHGLEHYAVQKNIPYA